MLLGRYYKNAITWYTCGSVTKGLEKQLKVSERFFKKTVINPPLRYFGSNGEIFGNEDGFEDLKNNNQITSNFFEKDLYPLSKDKTLISMKPLNNINEIFQHYEDFENQYNGKNFALALQKIWIFYEMFPTERTNILSKLDFFLRNMNKIVVNMDLNECIYCLFYLVKLDINSDHFCIQNLFLKSYNFLEVEDKIELSTLSRFAYIINKRKEFYNFDVCSKVLLPIAKHLENLENCDDLYTIATCFHNIISYVPDDIIKKYKNNIEEAISINHFDTIPTKHLLRIATIFSYPKWSNLNHNLNRKLLIFLSNRIDTMDMIQLELTCKLFQSTLEPANMLPKLLEAVKRNNYYNLNTELIAFVANFHKSNRANLIKKSRQITENLLSKQNILNWSSSIYKLMRNLKISDLQICNLYWLKVLNEIKSREPNGFLLVRYCFRYMFFNNNVGGTFRNLEFEKTSSRLAVEIINNNDYEKNKKNFVKLVSFIIAYGVENKNKSYDLSQALIMKIKKIENSLDQYDCFHLSKGFQIASELIFKNNVPKSLVSKMGTIKNIIERCLQRLLYTNEMDFFKLTLVIRTLNNIKVNPTSELYVTAIGFHETLDYANINSRWICEMALNFRLSNYLVSTTLTKSFDYIYENKDFVLGDTVEKLLRTSYILGYIPENEDMLYWSGEIIKRDFDFMTSTSIVQACLALCYFRALPLQLVQKVFTPEFVKKIEEEIELCYSKQTYPSRILNQVMQLNRAVCLDFPEMQIPWFQQNYIEAQMSKSTINPSKMFTEIENVLLSVIKNGDQILRNQTTPYGYTIDFVIHLNNQGVMSPEISKLNQTSRVAILLLKKKAYCINNIENIKGYEHMRVRHLEMLGFNVIHINITDWNALHMNIPGAKVMYLKDLLKLS